MASHENGEQRCDQGSQGQTGWGTCVRVAEAAVKPPFLPPHQLPPGFWIYCRHSAWPPAQSRGSQDSGTDSIWHREIQAPVLLVGAEVQLPVAKSDFGFKPAGPHPALCLVCRLCTLASHTIPPWATVSPLPVCLRAMLVPEARPRPASPLTTSLV